MKNTHHCFHQGLCCRDQMSMSLIILNKNPELKLWKHCFWQSNQQQLIVSNFKIVLKNSYWVEKDSHNLYHNITDPMGDGQLQRHWINRLRFMDSAWCQWQDLLLANPWIGHIQRWPLHDMHHSYCVNLLCWIKWSTFLKPHENVVRKFRCGKKLHARH